MLSPLALPYQYATAPIASLDVQMDAIGSVGRTDGCATVEWACAVFRRVGLDAEPYPRIRPFTRAPLRWNTYTALDAPLLDGGPWLVPIEIGGFGVLMGALWTLSSLGAVGGRILYAILSPAVFDLHGVEQLPGPLSSRCYRSFGHPPLRRRSLVTGRSRRARSSSCVARSSVVAVEAGITPRRSVNNPSPRMRRRPLRRSSRNRTSSAPTVRRPARPSCSSGLRCSGRRCRSPQLLQSVAPALRRGRTNPRGAQVPDFVLPSQQAGTPW